MKHLKCILFLIVTSHAFAQHIDTSQYAIFTYNDNFSDQFPSNCTKASLTVNEISKAEYLLNKCIAESNIEGQERYDKYGKEHPDQNAQKKDFIIDIRRYKRQYVAAITPEGEKIIWINCFCEWDYDWKKKLLFVEDGGNCYFNLKVNLNKNIYYDFYINGTA